MKLTAIIPGGATVTRNGRTVGWVERITTETTRSEGGALWIETRTYWQAIRADNYRLLNIYQTRREAAQAL